MHVRGFRAPRTPTKRRPGCQRKHARELEGTFCPFTTAASLDVEVLATKGITSHGESDGKLPVKKQGAAAFPKRLLSVPEEVEKDDVVSTSRGLMSDAFSAYYTFWMASSSYCWGSSQVVTTSSFSASSGTKKTRPGNLAAPRFLTGILHVMSKDASRTFVLHQQLKYTRPSGRVQCGAPLATSVHPLSPRDLTARSWFS